MDPESRVGIDPLATQGDSAAAPLGSTASPVVSAGDAEAISPEDEVTAPSTVPPANNESSSGVSSPSPTASPSPSSSSSSSSLASPSPPPSPSQHDSSPKVTAPPALSPPPRSWVNYVILGMAILVVMAALGWVGLHFVSSVRMDCEGYGPSSTPCRQYGFCANELLCEVLDAHVSALSLAEMTHQSGSSLLAARQTSVSLDQDLWRALNKLAGKATSPVVQEVMVSLSSSKKEFDSLKTETREAYDENIGNLYRLSGSLRDSVAQIKKGIAKNGGIWSEEALRASISPSIKFLVDAQTTLSKDRDHFEDLTSKWKAHARNLQRDITRFSELDDIIQPQLASPEILRPAVSLEMNLFLGLSICVIFALLLRLQPLVAVMVALLLTAAVVHVNSQAELEKKDSIATLGLAAKGLPGAIQAVSEGVFLAENIARDVKMQAGKLQVMNHKITDSLVMGLRDPDASMVMIGMARELPLLTRQFDDLLEANNRRIVGIEGTSTGQQIPDFKGEPTEFNAEL